MSRNKKTKMNHKPDIKSSSPFPKPSHDYNNNANIPHQNTLQLRTNLTNAILSSSSNTGVCDSYDEAFGIAEAVLLDYYGDSCVDVDVEHVDVGSMAALLCDYMPETISGLVEAEKIVLASIGRGLDDNDEHDDDSVGDVRSQEEMNNSNNNQEPSDDDGDYIQDGECELCERDMKLTRHHLVPKETWNRIKPRLIDAAPYYSNGDIETANEITRMGTLSIFGGDEDGSSMLLVLQGLDSSSAVRTFLGGYVAKVCRHCHSMVHRCFSNMELAERYNTVDKLLGDERVYKYCKWSNKQKPGKYKH